MWLAVLCVPLPPVAPVAAPVLLHLLGLWWLSEPVDLVGQLVQSPVASPQLA